MKLWIQGGQQVRVSRAENWIELPHMFEVVVRRKRDHSTELEEVIPEAYLGLQIVPVKNSQSVKLIIYRMLYCNIL